MQRSLIVGLLGFATGCIGHRPEIMTPVRIDAFRPLTNAPVQVTAARPLATLGEDPFRRLDRLEWPGPNPYRTATGAPGPDYWQQRADYTIVATLDTTCLLYTSDAADE